MHYVNFHYVICNCKGGFRTPPPGLKKNMFLGGFFANFDCITRIYFNPPPPNLNFKKW